MIGLQHAIQLHFNCAHKLMSCKGRFRRWRRPVKVQCVKIYIRVHQPGDGILFFVTF